MKSNKKDFLSVADLSRRELWELLLLARKLKKKKFSKILRDRTIGLIFQKPSTRTSISFAVGVNQLGGNPLVLNANILQIKRGETPRDTGRVLSRYLDAVVIRADSHEEVQEMAKYASIPFINGLTEMEHPCQVMADVLTIMEKLKLKHPRQLSGIPVTYLGDGNNIAHSWMLAAALLGLKLKIASPNGYEPDRSVRFKANSITGRGKKAVQIMVNPKEAIRGSRVVYTDVWASMGQESESRKRKRVFMPYQLNRRLLKLAHRKALVMHCLPAHRGEEITDDVLEGPQSVIFDQVENRLHMQKAILASLLSRRRKG